MKKIIVFISIFCLLALSAYAGKMELNTGDLFHVTGYENGELVLPVINLWSKPGGIANGARVIGKLSGDGRA